MVRNRGRGAVARRRLRNKKPATSVPVTPKTQQEKDKQQEEAAAIAAAARNKIKVSGLPRFYTLSDPLLQSFLKTAKEDLKLNVVHTRFSKKGNAWLYLSFPSEEEQIAALEVLKRFTWQGRTLISTLVTTDELKRKKMNGEDTADESSAGKKQKIDIPLGEQVLMSQIPFYSIDYEEQLSKKHEEAQSLLARVRDLMIRQGPSPKEWCDNRCKELGSEIPFVLDKIRPCPMINEYRNKFDFIVGYKPHLETYGVGVRVKDADDGTLQVGPIDELRNLPKPMIQLAKIFDGYINKDNHTHWLCFTVRKNSSDEYMVLAVATSSTKSTKGRGRPTASNPPKENPVVKVEPGTESAKPAPAEAVREAVDPAFLEKLKKDVVELFKNVDFCQLKSVYLQVDRGLSKNDTDLYHLAGETQIKERLHNLEIEISPLTFFRQNSLGTEVLCSVVEELAGLTPETVLLDLFCGSGSLSLTLAKKCKQVIGVEVLESNLKDAQKNAELNKITNCEFIAGKIEDQIEGIMTKLEGKEVVVVLDPPRSGIHAQIVKALRNFSFCKRFVYVCSNHKLPFRNLLDLSFVVSESKMKEKASNPHQKAFTTDPFIPVRVIPVDMTPHSLRSELVIQCDRLPKKDFQNAEPVKSTATENTGAPKQGRSRNRKKPAGAVAAAGTPGKVSTTPNKPNVPGKQTTPGRKPAVRGTGLRGTNVRGAGLRGTGVRGAGMRGAGLRGAGMRGTGMRGIGMRGTGMRGTVMRGTNVRGRPLFSGPNRYGQGPVQGHPHPFEAPQRPGSLMGPSPINQQINDQIAFDSILDIERRAYEKGLVKGLERSAYQMGLAEGMTKTPPNRYDEAPSNLERPGASSWNEPSDNYNRIQRNSAGGGGGSYNAQDSSIRDAPNPWSDELPRNSNSSFSRPSPYDNRSTSRNWNSPDPKEFGFSSLRNSSAGGYDARASDRSSFRDSARDSFDSTYGRSSLASSFIDSHENPLARRSGGAWADLNAPVSSARNFSNDFSRRSDQFGSSQNSSWSSNFSNGFGNKQSFSPPKNVKRGASNSRGGTGTSRGRGIQRGGASSPRKVGRGRY